MAKQKFKSEDPKIDLSNLLHISHNLNLAINKYFEDFGAQRRQNLKYWNNKMIDFLNSKKIN